MYCALRPYFPAMPAGAEHYEPWIAAALALFGLVLWLIGSRFSRSLVSLLAVAVGAGLGLALPKWTGWSASGWTIAVAGALLLGVAGYILHQGCVRAGLGLVLGTASVIGAWTWQQAGGWSPPQPAEGICLAVHLQQTWQSLPGPQKWGMSAAGGVGLLVGLLIGIKWPRLASAAFYSIVGTGLLSCFGLEASGRLVPSVAAWVPSNERARVILAAGLIVLGVVVQWILMPRRKATTRAESYAAPRSADQKQGGG